MSLSKLVFVLVFAPVVLGTSALSAADQSQNPVRAISSRAVSAPIPTGQQPMSKGEYLARVGNCVGCHTLPGGQPFAGGLKMEVPDAGTIHATNITPDPETGIGKYSFEDFDTVMRTGKSLDGTRLYPAMPYPSYAKTSVDDMHALYDFFMKEVKPVKQKNPENRLTGLRSNRWLLGNWNLLYLDDKPFVPVKGKSEAWNRGAYLTESLGHCGACHTPRGALAHEKAMDSKSLDYLAGASLDHWSASPLNGNINSGLGRMTEAEVVEFLKTGKNKFGTAFGTMVEVINSSTQFMTDSDLQAMATFLKSLPAASAKEKTPYKYDEATYAQLANMQFDKRGSQIYFEYCVTCHSYNGRGQSMLQPPLAGNPVVLDPDADSLINLTLNGSLRVIAQGHAESFDMPHLRTLLSDQQVADVVTFIRSSWGKSAAPVNAKDVAEIRAETVPVSNDDIVVLRMK
jgi:mono/diheme cytochrome c family protein